jgi:hypothetical protein
MLCAMGVKQRTERVPFCKGLQGCWRSVVNSRQPTTTAAGGPGRREYAQDGDNLSFGNGEHSQYGRTGS